jgi:ketosteroid isomerase-like protein
VSPILDIAAAQRALDALITGDDRAAVDQFTDDVVMTGSGGCLSGHVSGQAAVIDRFADMSRLTNGTFGVEVEAVYAGNSPLVVVLVRNWAAVNGSQVHGTQALVVTVLGQRISAIDALSRPGSTSGIWD